MTPRLPLLASLAPFALLVPLTLACSSAPSEDYAASAAALSTGEYASRATNLASSPYIGNWENNGGYVLGYLVPGGRIYAQEVRDNSVYGLIENAGYGAWDEGHHCGWVSLDGLSGGGSHSDVGDICPAWDNSFSLANGGQSPQLFKPGTVVVSDGVVQPAVVLPTCPDFTVYANYDPVTHTFSNPDGVERAGRGTMWTSGDPNCKTYGGVAQQGVTAGYCGFGTRFISADGVAVQIKDTQRGSDVTAFGFMHSECIAGSQVGNPSPPALACGGLGVGGRLVPGQSVASCGGAYDLALQTDGNLVLYQGTTALWNTGTEGRGTTSLSMQTDGNLVLYAGGTALWASGTYGHPGATFAVQEDGNLVVYAGTTPLWARFGLAPPPPPPPPPQLHCCAHCKNRQDAYAATENPDCRTAAIDFCSINDRGGVSTWYEGTCGAAP